MTAHRWIEGKLTDNWPAHLGGASPKGQGEVVKGRRANDDAVTPDGSSRDAADKWAAYVAGDENIFFPALVALVSLEEHNPGVFDRFMVFSGDRKTAQMDALLERYGIFFIDAASLKAHEVAMSLARMEGEEGRWPVEVFLNWILPEHFYAQGYRYSLKLDYDTLTIGEFPTSAFERQPFSLAAKQVDIRRGFPEDAVVKAKAELGQDVSFTEYYNVGVVVFDNSRAAEVEFFDWFASLYRLLSEACRDVQGLDPMEQLCFAALAKNLGGVKTLSPRLHTKVNVTRNIDPGFTSGTVILHFHSPFKPWKPLSPAEVVMLTEKKRWPMLPFYRTVWLDYASRVEGFADFCDQQPYTAIEIMCLANTVLLVEKKMIASMRLEEAAQSPS